MSWGNNMVGCGVAYAAKNRSAKCAYYRMSFCLSLLQPLVDVSWSNPTVRRLLRHTIADLRRHRQALIVVRRRAIMAVQLPATKRWDDVQYDAVMPCVAASYD
jgi:hypothetical protein